MISKVRAFSPIILLLAACASSDATDTTGPAPSNPAPAATTRTATGVVYVRDESVAYAADATSPPGVAGAALKFGETAGTSGGGGAYSISTTTTPPADYLDVSATVTGYQPAWTPYLTYAASSPVHIALYPDATVVKRPGFIKGIEFTDSGGGLASIYAAGKHAQTMDVVRNQDNVNLVMSTEHLTVERFDTATNTVKLGNDPWGNYTPAMYQDLVAKAHARGLQYMMNIGMYVFTYLGNCNICVLPPAEQALYKAANSIPATKTAFWDAYFEAWGARLVEHAKIARDAGVEYLAIGFNMNYATRLETARWQKIIADIRATGYTGKITYFAVAAGDKAGYNEWTFMPAATRALFDVVSVRLEGIIRGASGEVLAKEYSRARMRADVTALLNTMSSYNAPIILWVTTASVHGGVSSSEFIEACIVPACGSTAPSKTRDFQQQADAYQAVAEAVNATPVGNGRVMGIISSQYWYFEDYTSGGNAAYDKGGGNVRGKPAEAVMKWWFERW